MVTGNLPQNSGKNDGELKHLKQKLKEERKDRRQLNKRMQENDLDYQEQREKFEMMINEFESQIVQIQQQLNQKFGL
jgi:predicted nuclease with TOPRIM domain